METLIYVSSSLAIIIAIAFAVYHVPTKVLALQHSVSRLFNNTVMPFPVDVLLVIIEHVDKATLVKMCRLNKVCCSYSQDILYREISARSTHVTQTLARSTHLARRVRSFKAPYNDYDPDLYGALQNMINLRHLDLGGSNISNLLEGCTFTLVSFSCVEPQFQPLYQFLLGQPSLTSLSLITGSDSDIDDWPEFGATCLPNLTRVVAAFSKLPQLIANRPVTEVISLGEMEEIIPVDLSFFTLSNSPIQKLKIDFTYLYPKSGQYLTSIFSSLTSLEITADTTFLAIVRDPPFIIIIYP
jgi:hypothetical protein